MIALMYSSTNGEILATMTVDTDKAMNIALCGVHSTHDSSRGP